MGLDSKDDERVSRRVSVYGVFMSSILNSGWKPVCVRVHRDSEFLVRESEPNESFADGSHVDDQEDNMTENAMTKFPQSKSWMWRGGRLLATGIFAALAIIGVMMITTPEDSSSTSLAQVPRRASQFDLSNATVDAQEIRAGGPPKDGIPALTQPRLIPVAQADYLKGNDRVIGVMIDDQARAYPLAILNYHEIVNDTIANVPVAVTYCPLCDSVAVYDRRTPLGEREFGVSGLLYNSNVLMYDRGGRPESLWSQVKTTGISGPAADKQLAAVPCELTTWQSWKARHPDSVVLSPNTGHQRDYSRNPYGNYFTNQQLMFPVTPADSRLPNKERVLGVWVGDAYRAYPESRFPLGQDEISDKIGDKQLTIVIDRNTKTMRVTSADEGVSWLYSFWFAWYALHPDTTVYGDPPAAVGNSR